MSQMKKSNLSIGLLAGAGLSGMLGSMTKIGNYFYDLALLPMRERENPLPPFTSKEMLSPDAPADSPMRFLIAGRNWLANHPRRKDVFLTARDGLRLHAITLVPPDPSNRWVICIHGYWDDCTSMGLYAQHYYEQGHRILLPDLRGHGESEGHYVGMGFDDRLDIVSWISVLARRHPEAEIILHGVSMGAATALMTTGGALPLSVRAAVSDCAYTSAMDELQWIYQHYVPSHFPKGPAIAALRQVTKRRAGYDLKDACPIRAVHASKTPTLFLHGESDTLVPESMLHQLYSAASCPKEMHRLPNAGHALCAAVDSTQYWSIVDDFLNQY
jgi:alpha-beta hydrolase superfamily lysophospholipase